MANPLVNELIFNTPAKDKWNAAEPESEAQFQDFYKNPVLATAFTLVYGVPIAPLDGSPATNRTDLMSILLKYPGQALDGSNCGRPCSELLRLDLRVVPTAPESQRRLGAALRPGGLAERDRQELPVPAHAVRQQEPPARRLRRERAGRQSLADRWCLEAFQ